MCAAHLVVLGISVSKNINTLKINSVFTIVLKGSIDFLGVKSA